MSWVLLVKLVGGVVMPFNHYADETQCWAQAEALRSWDQVEWAECATQARTWQVRGP